MKTVRPNGPGWVFLAFLLGISLILTECSCVPMGDKSIGVSGLVLDSDNSPIAGANVVVSDPSDAATPPTKIATDASGTFRTSCDVAPFGNPSVLVRVKKAGFKPAEFEVKADADLCFTLPRLSDKSAPKIRNRP
jgi:hypothetical protein